MVRAWLGDRGPDLAGPSSRRRATTKSGRRRVRRPATDFVRDCRRGLPGQPSPCERVQAAPGVDLAALLELPSQLRGEPGGPGVHPIAAPWGAVVRLES